MYVQLRKYATGRSTLKFLVDKRARFQMTYILKCSSNSQQLFQKVSSEVKAPEFHWESCGRIILFSKYENLNTGSVSINETGSCSLWPRSLWTDKCFLVNDLWYLFRKGTLVLNQYHKLFALICLLFHKPNTCEERLIYHSLSRRINSSPFLTVKILFHLIFL